VRGLRRFYFSSACSIDSKTPSALASIPSLQEIHSRFPELACWAIFGAELGPIREAWDNATAGVARLLLALQETAD